MPKKILQRAKRYLRRECRKPREMKIRTFYGHLTHMARTELNLLPPFAADQGLPDDEVVDILLHATPKSWQRHMDLQGFDPVTKTPEEVVQFMENIETSEEYEDKKPSAKKDEKKKDKKKQKSNSSGEKHCIIHGTGSHTTEQCRTVKKLKEEGKAIKPQHKNKTWDKKADDAKKKSQKELKAFMTEFIRNEMNSYDKKRKSDDSDDDESMNMLDKVEKMDLSQFNYEDMNNLKLDDDTEIEV